MWKVTLHNKLICKDTEQDLSIVAILVKVSIYLGVNYFHNRHVEALLLL
jgi:hypothetical protein